MTTYFPFNPSAQQNVSFLPTLDGQQFNCVITWNLQGQRYYFNLYTLGGVLVICAALSASPAGLELQSLTWNQLSGQVTATTSEPHGYDIGQTIPLTISGASPSAYNGSVNVYITGLSTFTWPLTSDPGTATTYGAAFYTINLIAGLTNPNTSAIFVSTLALRNGQFESSP